MQIRTRLTLQFIVIVSSLLLVSLFTIYYFSNEYRKNEFYNQLIKKASSTAELLIKVHEVDSSLLKLIDKNRKDMFTFENISVYNVEDEEIYTNNDTLDFKKLIPNLHATIESVREKGVLKRTVGDLEVIGISFVDRLDKFVILAGAIDNQGQKNIIQLKHLLIVIFFVSLFLVGAFGWLFAGKALSPILKVVNEVDKITESNLNLRLDEGYKKDEIERLSSTFNKMLERIERAFEIQKTFIANASHELRNPLTKITSQLEVALLNERDNQSYKEIIISVLEDIRNLNEVSHRLLQITKLKSDASSLIMTPLRIDDLIWETKAAFLKLHPDYKVNFSVENLPEDENNLLTIGNSSFLKVCFSNLMDNGCKFSTDKTVSVSLFVTSENLEIVFKNNGSVIDSEDLPFVFEPFFRSKNSLGTNGYGIGLSLVKKIVMLHKGTIHVSSLHHEGTKFILVLPIAQF